ncbi:hypothetical protein ACQP1V_43145 (plasmid) [Microtetraspora malaysiensis]|uniref:hypothetical protein n=1 Tax=Microtetraspora malaysiensis TaxID=161358 RepID=UPI003D8A1EB0
MSRYVIPNPPGFPAGREITVGWDAPLDSFFASATDLDPEEGEIEVWAIGDSPCEIPTVAQLDAALYEHGVGLDGDMAVILAADKASEGERFAGRPATQLIASVMHGKVPAGQQARVDAALTGARGDGK